MKTKIVLLACLGLFFVTSSFSKNNKPEYYQLTVYKYKTADQEKMINAYLKNALLPALHKMNVRDVGVFKAIANDTASQKMMYVFFPVKSLNAVSEVAQKLAADRQYQQNGKDYIGAPYDAPAYDRMEVILMKAFSLAPAMKKPNLKSPKNERVYELRSYQSTGEGYFKNKVHMFNEGGEMDIFKKLNFNAVFYGEVIAGSIMPNLMYMTTFENKADRDAHWDAFGKDPDWKRLSSLPEYQHNMSHADITFLRPTDYSDY